jgi:prepilin-type N-terminal cleavage/methylation domain-containing protein
MCLPARPRSSARRGFTFIEVVVAMGIVAILLSLTYYSTFTAQHKSTIVAATDLLINDLKQQQLKAMSGDTAGSTTAADYGVHLEATSYTLFRGSVYNQSNSANFVVPLGGTLVNLANTLPASAAAFARGSGEVDGLPSGTASLTIRDTVTGETRIITINQYGTITAVQ